MFADDVKLYKIITCSLDIFHLQEDLNRFVVWSAINGMSLNIGKCCYISFYRGGKKFDSAYSILDSRLRLVSSIKDLGVEFTRDVTFSSHINVITARAHKVLGFIYRNSTDLSWSSVRLLYCSLVRSSLEYASIVWSPFYEVHKLTIERVQNRALRICAYRSGVRIINHDYNDI